MDEFGNVALTDFGMAKQLKGQYTQSIVGTPEYIAPEILNLQNYGKPADWWSFGTLMYEMMVGVPPFYSQNQERMFKMIKKSKVIWPKGCTISQEAKDLIQQLLKKNPNERLGVNGSKQIRTHPWFQKIDWEKCLAKKIKPSFIPDVDDEHCVDYFDEEFT